jgi:hypothetical protein
MDKWDGSAGGAAMTETKTYGPQEVCDAAGVSRATFHSWVARQYLPLPPGPGMGRERQFTLLDAIRVAVVVQLNRLGVPASSAGRASGLITGSHDGGSWALVLGPSSGLMNKDQTPKAPPMAMVRFTSLSDIELVLRDRFAGGAPAGFTMIDITAVADRTRAALEDPEHQHPLVTWLDRSLGTDQPKPHRRGARTQ